MLEDYLFLFFAISAISIVLLGVVTNLVVTYIYTKEWVSGEVYDTFNTRKEVVLGFFIMLFGSCFIISYFYIRNWYNDL